jgi:hypothetical protein
MKREPLRFQSREVAEMALTKVRAIESDPDIRWSLKRDSAGRFLVVTLGPVATYTTRCELAAATPSSRNVIIGCMLAACWPHAGRTLAACVPSASPYSLGMRTCGRVQPSRLGVPMRNSPRLAAVVAELEAAGVPYELVTGRRHPGVRWRAASSSRTMFVSGYALRLAVPAQCPDYYSASASGGRSAESAAAHRRGWDRLIGGWNACCRFPGRLSWWRPEQTRRTKAAFVS